jgi:hypothetical protein
VEFLIGTLGEKGLHSGLKKWYAQPGDFLEKTMQGFHIDIIRGNLLIEIQTGNFSSIKYKLDTLIRAHPVRLVFPVSLEKWIVRLASNGKRQLGSRKSPKKGSIYQLFDELVYIPGLVRNRHFSLEVVLVHEEEIRRNDGHGSRWRKGWSIADRGLMGVVATHVFDNPGDFYNLIPESLPNPFSTHDLSNCTGQPIWRAQKMVYCLRHMGAAKVVGKKGNSVLHSIDPIV